MNNNANLSDLVMTLKTMVGTWERTGNAIGISRSLAWRVAHGKSDSRIARQYFGLPVKSIDFEVVGACPGFRDKKRHRRAGDLFTAERASAYDQMLQEMSTTTTDVLNSMLDSWLNSKP